LRIIPTVEMQAPLDRHVIAPHMVISDAMPWKNSTITRVLQKSKPSPLL